MRCPDCSKFVSMETQDPQTDGLDVDFVSSGKADGEFNVTWEATTVRQCADCGTELKSLTVDAENTIPLEDFKGWDELTTAEQEELVRALDNDECQLKIEEESTNASESGGSRYAKNIITSMVTYRISFKTAKGEMSYQDNLSSENAASEFEECC